MRRCDARQVTSPDIHRRRLSRRRVRTAGRVFFLRPRTLCGALLVVAAAVVVPLSAAAATVSSATTIRDTIMPASGLRYLSTTEAFWGGTVTASTGERVTVRFSDSYPQAPALQQQWANLLASLLHGPELQTVALYLAPIREVQSVCGASALACYSPQQSLIVAPGERVAPDISAESIVMHEYGHHLAASRSDAPWAAVDWGTKRWSSYEQVCAKSRAGQLFPGAEDSQNYRLNPGEAFAETYRVLNERRLGIGESPWNIVSDGLYPDDAALALASQDITSPWTANATSSSSVALTKRAKVRNVALQTPLDGSMRITLRGVRNSRAALDLFDSAGASIAHTVVTGATTRSVSTTVCGARAYRARVTLQRGSGRFQLAVSKP
jgi:hypothetical protein